MLLKIRITLTVVQLADYWAIKIEVKICMLKYALVDCVSSITLLNISGCVITSFKMLFWNYHCRLLF